MSVHLCKQPVLVSKHGNAHGISIDIARAVSVKVTVGQSAEVHFKADPKQIAREFILITPDRLIIPE
jgi:hypothetical protein